MPREGFTIGIVADERTDTKTMVCLLGSRHVPGYEQTIVVEGSVGSFDVGRNKVVSQFLDTSDSEWLVTIDTDMVWARSQLTSLIESADPTERPVVSGIYFVNDKPPRPCMVRRDQHGVLRTISTWEDGELVEVDGIGGGFMAIHYTILEEIERVFEDRDDRAGPWYRQSAVGASRQMLEPDHAFVQRVQQLGHKVYVDTDIFVGHIKPRILGWEI